MLSRSLKINLVCPSWECSAKNTFLSLHVVKKKEINFILNKKETFLRHLREWIGSWCAGYPAHCCSSDRQLRLARMQQVRTK